MNNLNVLIIGLGATGKSVASFLDEKNVQYDIYDDHIEQYHMVIDEDKMKQYDGIIKSPGVSFSHRLLKMAEKNNISVMSDIDLAYLFYPEKYYIGITGTNGKSTTTKMIEEILKEDGKSVIACGNYGTPILDVVETYDYLIVECSSFQLAYLKQFHPNIAIILNMGVSHLDQHKTVEEYYLAKYNIFKKQTEDDILIISTDVSNQMKQMNIHTMANIHYYDLNHDFLPYYHLLKQTYQLESYKKNLAAAYEVATILNVNKKHIEKAMQQFKGLPYRCEYIGTISDDVLVYNDSKSTNPDSTLLAIKEFNEPVILICGGQDRGNDFSIWNQHLSNIELAVVYGENEHRIQKVLEKNNCKTILCENLDMAIQAISDIIINGKVILFSPASSSWDQFKNYKERGNHFNILIKQLRIRSK